MKSQLKPLLILITLLLSTLNATQALPPLVKAGEPLAKLKSLYIPQQSEVHAVAISADGSFIVSGSSDGSLKIWETKSGRVLKTLEGHSSSVSSVAISADGSFIVSGSRDNSLKIWETKSGRVLKTLEGHSDFVNAVAISTDGSFIVSSSSDGSLKIWETKSGRVLKTLEGHSSSVSSVAISADGSFIVSGSRDNSLKIWNTKSGRVLKTLEGHSSSVYLVAISADGSFIVSSSADNSVKIWETKSGRVLKTLEGYSSSVTSVAISADGSFIVSSSSDGSLKIWETKSGRVLKTLEGHSRAVSSVAISADGSFIVSGSSDRSVKIWDTKSGNLLKTLEGHSDSVNSIAISTDGRFIVSGSNDQTLKIWNTQSGKPLKTLKGHSDSVNSVAISTDGRFIVSGSNDQTLKIWNTQSGKLLKTLNGEIGFINSVAISQDGSFIVSGSQGGTLKIWSTKQGKELKPIDGGDSMFIVSSVFISRDENFIVTGSYDGKINIFGIKSNKFLKTIRLNSYPIISVAISKDGSFIVSGSSDGSVKMWDTKSGEVLKSFWGGINSCWINFDYKKDKFYRGDDGTLLYHKEDSKLINVFPKDYNLNKKDKLKIRVKEKDIKIATGSFKELHFIIENLAKQNSYFLNIYGKGESYSTEFKKIDKIEGKGKKEISLKLFAKLERLNPQPREVNATVTLLTGNGSEFNLSFPIKVLSPYLVVKEAKVSKDKKNLNVLVANKGSVDLAKAEVKLTSPFEADPQTLTSLKVGGSKTLSFALPKDFNQSKALSISFEMPNQEEIANNPSTTKIAPAYAWSYDNLPIDWAKMAWYFYALMALAMVLLAGLIFYYRRYKNPLVVKLANDPKSLKNLTPSQLKEAKERLLAISRWESTLSQAGVKTERFESCLKFFESDDPSVQAKIFAQQIGAKSVEQEGAFFYISMAEGFKLNNIKNFMLYLCNDSYKDIAHKVMQSNERIYILSDEQYQDAIAKEAEDKTNRLIAPRTSQMSQLFLEEEGEDAFIATLSRCLLLKDVSPYQTHGDVKSHANFFGRIEILREILSNNRQNYLLVGGRQLGKSSILKALQRRYAKSTKVQCYYFTLDEKGDIVQSMAEQMGLEGVSSLEEVVSAIKVQKRKPIFLVDEADVFVKLEKENGYAISALFRKLAQEGYATFVLTGFWTLYEHVVFEYQSPLHNFGKLITLGGLEKEACKELMIKPMKQIGVSYENLALVEQSIVRCGYRANYIATVCDEVLKGLMGSTITEHDLEEVFQSQAIEQMLS